MNQSAAGGSAFVHELPNGLMACYLTADYDVENICNKSTSQLILNYHFCTVQMQFLSVLVLAFVSFALPAPKPWAVLTNTATCEAVNYDPSCMNGYSKTGTKLLLVTSDCAMSLNKSVFLTASCL
jgi:hypothetical protein